MNLPKLSLLFFDHLIFYIFYNHQETKRTYRIIQPFQDRLNQTFSVFLTFPPSSYFILLANPILTFNIFRSIVNFHLLFFSLFLFLHSNISFLYSTNKISQLLQDLSQSMHLSITLRCVVPLYDFTFAPICFDRGIWYDKLGNCFHLWQDRHTNDPD